MSTPPDNASVQISKPELLPSGKKLIRAGLAGSFTKADAKLLSAWATSLNEEVVTVSDGKDASVVILTDIHELGTYDDPKLISILIDLMKNDSPYVYRAATFGGTHLHIMIENVITTMSGRSNLKNFKTEDEALKWIAE